MRHARSVLPVSAALATTLLAACSLRGQCGSWLYSPQQGVRGVTMQSSASAWIDDAIAWDPDGPGPAPELLVAAGLFELAGDVLASNIATWDGQRWAPLGAGLDQWVWCLEVHDGSLIAGGNFLNAGGQPATRIARWNGTSWSPFGPGMNGTVTTMTHYNGELVAGGGFATAQGYGGIARWDGTQWVSFSTGMNNVVYALEVYNGDLIAAGSFTQAGGVPVQRTARWDGLAWSPMGTSTQSVSSLRAYNGDLYRSGGVPLQRWTGSAWQAVPDAQVGRQLTVYNGELIVGGSFYTQVGGETLSSLAAWNGSSWRSLGRGVSQEVASATPFRNSLFVGGSFTLAGSVPVNSGALWDGAAWSAMGTGLNEGTRVTEWQGELLVTPAPAADSPHRVGAATWHGADLEQLGTGWSNYLNVLATSTSGNDLLLGGVSMSSGTDVLRWDAAQNTWRDEPSTPVRPRDFTTWNGTLYACGFEGLVQRSGGVWAGVPGPLTTFCIAPYENRLIAAGNFTQYSGSQLARIAAWDGLDWLPLGSGLNSNVQDLRVYQGRLIATGGFTTAGGVPASRIAAWDGQAWSPLGAGLSGSGQTMIEYHGDLVVGGTFLQAGGLTVNRIARWNGQSWSGFDGGVAFGQADGGIGVRSLAIVHDELIAGGYFYQANGRPSVHWARWTDTGVPWIARQPAAASAACGTTHTLTVTPASGYTITSYAWRKDGTPLQDEPGHLSGSGSGALIIMNTSPADGGSYDCVLTSPCGPVTSTGATLTILPCGNVCDTIDFNHDSLFPDTLDIDDFLTVFSGGPCSNDPPAGPGCGDIDFNNDGLFPDTDDIDTLLRVFSGGAC